MVENTKIEWATHTFNPWIGCAKVSPGCEHCYAETLMDTRYGKVEWGKNGTRVMTADSNWRKPVKWELDAHALQQYHAAKLATDAPRPRVFCASLADVFEDRDELTPWLARLVMLIEDCPSLDWLLLTKRPECVLSRLEKIGLSPDWFELNPHVWIGTSVENQQAADERIPHLLKIPAAVRFLSCEPLLGPVDFGEELEQHNSIHWVIVGGESGPNARPMHPDWARSLRDQCQSAGVPFFFKQWGEFRPWDAEQDAYKPGGLWLNTEGKGFGKTDSLTQPGYTLLRHVGKKAAGRLLDGREWSQFPEGKI